LASVRFWANQCTILVYLQWYEKVNLRTKWVTLQKDLQGKVRVTVGNNDNFLLNYAVHMLDDEMKKLGSPFVFGYYPGDHFTVATPQWRTDGFNFLEERYITWMATH
jgi:hypothetical protein